MAKPHAHIRLDFSGTCSIGPGKIGLLEALFGAERYWVAGRSLPFGVSLAAVAEPTTR